MTKDERKAWKALHAGLLGVAAVAGAAHAKGEPRLGGDESVRQRSRSCRRVWCLT